MKCFICRGGEPRPGFATVALTRDESVFVLKGVPADVCQDCGEYYLSDEMTGIVLDRAEQAILFETAKPNALGSEVEIQRYAA
jgi:YgiT-type zinc finger domain-containing protein